METTAFGGCTAAADKAAGAWAGGVACWAHALLATRPVTKRTLRRSIGVFLVAACCSSGGVGAGRPSSGGHTRPALLYCVRERVRPTAIRKSASPSDLSP